jgi:hypothetical protein
MKFKTAVGEMFGLSISYRYNDTSIKLELNDAAKSTTNKNDLLGNPVRCALSANWAFVSRIEVGEQETA